jgi:hypothetical protein
MSLTKAGATAESGEISSGIDLAWLVPLGLNSFVSVEASMQRINSIGRRTLLAMGALLIAALAGKFTAAHAQNCRIIGTQTYCDNGVSGQRIGSTTYWNDAIVIAASR